MNKHSLCLSASRRLAIVALFLVFFVVWPSYAQFVKVGDNSPIDPAQAFSPSGPQYCNGDTSLTDCYFAQAFSLSAGTFIDQIDLTLLVQGNPPQCPGTFPISIVITDQLVPDLVPILQQDASIPIPCTGNFGVSNFVNQPFSVSFPVIFLPSGTYYLAVLFPSGGHFSETPFLLWAANQVGSAEVGILGQAFCQGHASFNCTTGSWLPLTTNGMQATTACIGGYENPACDNLDGTNGTFSFQLSGSRFVNRHGGGRGQILRILVKGPITPPPGAPIEAQLGFVDTSGNPIGPSATVTVGPGEMQWLDLNLSEFVTQFGERIEVQPVVVPLPNVTGAPAPASQLSATVQILDELTGFETVFSPVPQPPGSVSNLVPHVLAGGQTMRISVAASKFAPCNATLSFADKKGDVLGSSLPVNLSPGTGTSLDLSADSLGLTFGRQIEVQPIVTPTASTTSIPVNSVCQVTVEVFDHLTGRTWTTQSSSVASPALQ